MPLVYDDEPGSWGRLSEGWPELRFPTLEQYKEAWRYCVRGDDGKGAVPYGSYVSMAGYVRGEHVAPFIIRFETTAYRMKVHTHMQEWKRKQEDSQTAAPRGSRRKLGHFLMRKRRT